MRSFLCVVICVAAMVVGIQTSALAATPLIINCSNTPGAQIDHPGSYVLSAGVPNCGATTAISITASYVSLDLGGYALDGVNTHVNTGVAVAAAVRNVRIFHGEIHEFGTPVDLGPARRSSVTRMTLHDGTTCISGSNSNTFAGNSISNCTSNGIFAGNLNRVRGNIFQNVGAPINLGNGNVVSKNSIVQSAGGIFAAGGNKIVNNSISRAGGGIAVGGHNTITGNVLSNLNDDAITASDHNKVTKNVVNTADGTGITVGVGNKLIGNVVSGLTFGGIKAGDGTTLKNNRSDDNSGAGIDTGNRSIVKGNEASGNGADGIAVESTEPLTKTTVKGNSADNNGYDGIALTSVGGSVLVTKNTSSGNVHQGIHVAPSTAPSGAKTNSALDNGTDPQCDFNLCR